MSESLRIAVVTPVFDDWPSCARLLGELNAVAGEIDGAVIDVLIVDDGSSAGVDVALLDLEKCTHFNRVNITELASNLGHQRAIACGLHQAVEASVYEHIIIMDCDGEDQPRDVLRLLDAQRGGDTEITVAGRLRRSEGLLFKLFYRVYKSAYRLLTGNKINFGNFSIVSRAAAQRLLHMPELWNNFPSAVLRSRLPFAQVETERGKRYSGDGKMSFVQLVIHGLNAISVSSEVVFVRVMVFCAGIALASILGAAVVVFLRLFTDLAIPGWASDVIGSLTVILTQTLFFFFIVVFLLLNARSNPTHTPRSVIPGYISRSYDVLVDGELRL